ncbi:MAG: hypothetical protein ABI542_09755 [Gemmatimonadota bacterium]
MNRELVRVHLREAREAIDAIVRDIEQDPEYNDAGLWVEMQHVYHHVNTAWNARNATDAAAEPVSEENFRRWNRFPLDLPMME